MDDYLLNYTYNDLVTLIGNKILELYKMDDYDILMSLIDYDSDQRELLRGFVLLMKKLGFEGSKESEK